MREGGLTDFFQSKGRGQLTIADVFRNEMKAAIKRERKAVQNTEEIDGAMGTRSEAIMR